MRFFLPAISVLFFFFISDCFLSQNVVEGTIYDERNVPIPYAKVYVKNDPDQRTVSDVNGKYRISLMPDEYFLVFSSFGFDDRESYISISAKDIIRDIQLFPSRVQDLDAIQVSAKKSNPGREIMKKVVGKRAKFNPWNYPHKVNVYIKAREDIKRKKAYDQDESVEFDESFDGTDPLKDTMNLLEVQLQRNYAPGNKVKEYRNAFT